MKIVTVHFEKPNDDYRILLDVYRESIRRNLHGVELVEIEIPFPEDMSGRGLFCHFNHEKLVQWQKYLETAAEPVVFTDCDMLALHSPAMIFRDDFDIGYTVRTKEAGNSPINGGVVFAKPTKEARDFFRVWLNIDGQMLTDEELHTEYCQRYSGLNQSSFGYMLEKYVTVGNVKEYKTRPYNCVECDWRDVDGSEFFIHIKTRLRRECLRAARGYPGRVPARIEKPLALWLDVYKRIGK